MSLFYIIFKRNTDIIYLYFVYSFGIINIHLTEEINDKFMDIQLIHWFGALETMQMTSHVDKVTFIMYSFISYT